ncbi:glycoside hydrolase family 16 protein [Hymenobacter ruricola]|uniref:Glycoside hydrolase family 16 protein n=1 Tax=Hymenobacter ruricola TaxID=2791023 RepID=A0ABS0IAS9_9BACT|nr:glycoside hydrolase family 16 protein [Hymenobacter ruricola]MBF9223738.1 glycoside hydrolase family 16 protein [Hymenobacter ruricola]
MMLQCFRVGLLLLLLSGASSLTGAAQRRVNYADWKLEWAEEFNGPVDTLSLMTRWRFAYPWGRNLDANSELQYYTGTGVRPGTNGTLNLVSARLPQSIPYRRKQLTYSSGMLISHHPADSLRPQGCQPDNGFSYGLFEVRCRQPYDGASFPAFWLWGGVPDEVDVFEANRAMFNSTLHITGGGFWRPSRTKHDECSCSFHNVDAHEDLHTQFHTYGLEWLPNELIFYFDGVPIRHETRLVPEGCAMYLIVNLAVSDWVGVPGDTLALDYIRVYRPRRLPSTTLVRHGGEGPFSELEWLPWEQKPGRLDVSRHQSWTATPRPDHRLELFLTDNRNPLCDQEFPLPHEGRWAPPWVVVDNLPALALHFAQAEPVAWTLANALGLPVARGTIAAPTDAARAPRWPRDMPPGAYTLHLRQGEATVVHPVVLLGRTRHDATPTATWLLPAPLPQAPTSEVAP